MTIQELKNEVAVVTGASRGIGRSIAVALAKQGCNVALLARTKEDLERTEGMCKEANSAIKTGVYCCDVSKREDLQKTVDCIVSNFGMISILVNDAGVGASGGADEADLNDWDRVIEVNLRAPMALTRMCLPAILASKSKHKTVLFIGSVAALISMKGSAAYCASKFGIRGFAGCVFEDVREHGVKVCVIHPGYVNTDLVSDIKGLQKAKMIQPSDVAQQCLSCISLPDNVCPVEVTMRPQRDPKA
eukprot:ANDGO_06371.mRNA.1 putative oxidoreductase SSP0419